ncbi:hypothetical protein [Pseudomonas aeruginosa]|nr:hypothetical protein [Pseudomonas aeruginosa]MCT7418422.1 hypothetical protein [Pseudomonas aeruginosa]
MTSDVDFSTIATSVLAVAALLATVYAGIKGARMVLGFLRS